MDLFLSFFFFSQSQEMRWVVMAKSEMVEDDRL